jgi:hypothetical protein
MAFFENDLFVVVRLAFPAAKKVIVLDPAKIIARNYDCGFLYAYTREQVMNISKEKKQFLLVNMSGAASFSFPFDFNFIEGIISFNDIDETSLDFFHYRLFYVVDQQNMLRWLISENHKQTDFLSDYYQPQFTTDVSNLFSGFSSLSNYLKVKWGKLKKVTDGTFQVLKRDRHFFASIQNDQYDSFTINFKTHTSPGLIRVRLYKQNKYSWVINHAINDTGMEKVANEKMVLTEISKNSFNHLGIPGFFVSDHNIAYKIDPSFKPAENRHTRKLLNTILTDAVLEYQSLYNRKSTIKQFWKGNGILKDLNWIRGRIANNQIPRGISAINLTKLYSKLLQIFNELDINKHVYISLNNNLLYSENIFSSGSKLYFTSWVNADFDLPIFYDLFQKELYYIDESSTADFEILSDNIQIELENQNLKTFADQHNIDIDIQFKVFIIITFITELKLLVVKKMVMPETNIKLYNWLELLNRLNIQ